MPAYKNERGSWNVKFYYTDWTGKRKQKKKEGFKTKKEAQSFELDFLNKCENSVDITFCIRRSPAAAGAVVNGSSAVTAAAV